MRTIAELDAFGKAVKGFAVTPTLNADGSAVIALDGVQNWHPRLKLNPAETAAVQKALAAKPVEPPPPPPPNGEILWVADGTAPLDQQIASVSVQGHCGQVATPENTSTDRLRVVTDSRFSKGRAVQAVMKAGDNCYSGRSEANFGNPPKPGFHKGQYHPGDEVWVAGEVLYGPNYPIGSNDKGDHCGGTNFQFHSWGGVGAATLGLCCNADSSPQKYGRIETWGEQKSMQLVFDKAVVGQVYKIVFHMKFASSGGLAEVYFAEGSGGIGSPVLKAQYLNAFTINPAGTYEGKVTNFSCFGFYENTNRKGESRGEVLWGGLTGATTRAAAEAKAFSSS